MNWDQVRQDTERRLAAMTATDAPFPHIYMRDVFPDALFRALRANLPPDDALEATDPARSNNPFAVNRRKFAIDPPHLARMEAGQRAFWSTAWEWLAGPTFTRTVLGCFKAGIAARYGNRPLDLVSRIEINVDRENYAIQPHTDSPKKVVSMLFYLPEDDRRADLGTSIYVPKDPMFRSEQALKYPFEWFDPVRTFPMPRTAAWPSSRPTIPSTAARQ